jgi:PST family polysaccharide transporter
MTRSIVGSVALWIAAKWRPGVVMSLRHLKDIYEYSIKVFIDQQVIFISNRLDEGLVGYFLDISALGFYSIAKRLVLLLIEIFNSTLGMVMFPYFTKIQTDNAMIIKSLKFGLKFYFASTIPVFLGLAVLAAPIISVVFGKQWVDADSVTRIISISGPFLFGPLFIHAIFHAIGSPGVPLMLNVARAISSLILFPIGGFLGLNGIAAALVVKNIIGAILDIFALRTKVKMEKKAYLKQALVPFCLAIPTVALASALFANLKNIFADDLSLLIAVLFPGAFYIAILLAIQRSFVGDIKNIILGLKPAGR